MMRIWLAAILAAVSTCAFAVFQTKGELGVSDSGALTYSIPIAVPPGVGGMEPKLSLNYNSQGGNGLMGMGWSVSGLTAITRCPQTIAQDGVSAAGEVNYTANDRFCMDGQRLINLAGTYGGVGTEYRTELESYSKAVSYGGTVGDPQYFKVWTKAGQIIEYGNSADSRAEASLSGPARMWMVNRISDTKGNSIEFDYEEDTANGEHRPKEIRYTLNSAAGLTAALNSVVFHYEARPDTILGFHAGSPVKTTQRIAKLQVNARGKTVREYRFTYGVGNGVMNGFLIGTQRSHLLSLQECATDPVESCLNPTQFEWTTAYPGYEVTLWSTVGQKFHSGTYDKNTTGDFNGDGKTDVVSYIGDNNDRVTIHLSNGAGFNASLWYGQFRTSSASSKNWIGDFNGDGLSDIASWNSTSQVTINLSNGNGFTTQTWTGTFNSNATSDKNWLGDFNGDGLTDIAAVNGNTQLMLNLSTGSGFNTVTWSATIDDGGSSNNWLADFNGDGKTDIAAWCCGGAGLNMNLSTGTGFTTVQWSGLELYHNSGAIGRNYRGDYNGDGKTDIASWKSGGNLLVMHMSTGTGFVKEYWTSNLHDSTSNWIGDYNGDGRSDIASWNGDGTSLRVHLSEGTQFRREAWTTQLLNDKDSMYHWFGDFDGDGRTDIASRFREEITSTDPETGEIITSHGSIDDNKVNLHRAYDYTTLGAVYPDIITKVTEGMGATQTIDYLPLTNASVYDKGFGSGLIKGDGTVVATAYPYVDVEIPLYVVSRVRASNGIGGEMSSRYTYKGLRSHSQGRGLLGFALRAVTQEQRNITTTTEYAQIFPHAGMPLQARKELPGRGNSGLLSQSDMVYGCLDPDTGSACTFAVGKRYFPYASSTTEQSWELSGAALPATTTGNTYDLWGNVIEVSVNTVNAGGGKPYGKTTTSIYNAPDTANWILGRLQRATVTVTAPDAAAQ